MKLTKLLIILEFSSLFIFNCVYAESFNVIDTKETHLAVALEKAPGVLHIKDKTSKSIDNDLKRKLDLRKNKES